MSEGKPLDLGMKSALDELFMDDQGRAENRLPKIYEIPLSEIDDFPDHPFYVRNDEDMEQLVASVKERGIITPVMLRRKEDGRYEMVSGHRRKKACELAGLETIKAEIRELTQDQAVMLMVESNLQRSKILPSEKAFAYKMRLDAMNRQGQRTDLTLSPLATKLDSASQVGQLTGESRDQVFRYIRLTNLVPALLHMVDDGRIALRPAVELSYLHPTEQLSLVDTISYEESTPSLAQAIKMRQFSKAGKLNPDVILSIMCETKGNQRERISIPADRIRKFIPKELTPQKTEEYILAALEHYQKYRALQSRDAR